MSYLSDHYPGHHCDTLGNVYKDNVLLKPFKSNKYLQIQLTDAQGKKHVCGVHVAVAMDLLPEYYPGCVVHHKDHDGANNRLDNLEIMSMVAHARMHSLGNTHSVGRVPWNKGRKMDENFRQKCRESKLKQNKAK